MREVQRTCCVAEWMKFSVFFFNVYFLYLSKDSISKSMST